jgi:cell division septation protein DedD
MEANRNYIIILSVSLVLVGFFGAAAWLFYPYQMSSPGLDPAQISRFFQDPSRVPSAQSTESQPPQVSDTPTQPSSDLQIVYGILDDANFIDDPLGRRLNGVVDPLAETSVTTDNRLSVQVETRTPARELGTGVTTQPSGTTTVPTISQTTPTAQGTAQPRVSAQPVSPTTTRATTTGSATQARVVPQRSAQPTQTTIEEFWIQVVSSPNRDRVLLVQEDLESLGIGGRITTVQVDSQTFYRLRYGPYTQRAEAQKFLDWLKEIPRYQESFISIEFRTRNQ